LPSLPKDKKDSGCDFVAEVNTEENGEENSSKQMEGDDSSKRQTLPARAVREIRPTRSIPRGQGPTARARRDRRVLRRPSLIPHSIDKEAVQPPPGRKETRKRSVANNLRIQEIVHNKKIHPLASSIQESSTDDSDVPNSPDHYPIPSDRFAVTPWEIYDKPKPKLSLAGQFLRQDLDKFRFTPIDTDLGVLAVVSPLPERAPSMKSKLANMPQFRSRNPSLIELPSGSIIAVITPEQNAFQRSVYLPGKLVLENHSGNSPTSVLTPLDLMQETETQSSENDMRRWSEDVMVDDIVGYFEDFGSGFEFETLNNGLDEFWANSPVINYGAPVSRVRWPRPKTMIIDSRQGGVPPSFDPNLPGEMFAISFGSFDLKVPESIPESVLRSISVSEQSSNMDEYHEYRKRRSTISSPLREELFRPVIYSLEPTSTEPLTDEPPSNEPPQAEPLSNESLSSEQQLNEPPTDEPRPNEPPVAEPPSNELPSTEPPPVEPSSNEPPLSKPASSKPPSSEVPSKEPQPNEQQSRTGSVRKSKLGKKALSSGSQRVLSLRRLFV
jgi:hypothetical protein